MVNRNKITIVISLVLAVLILLWANLIHKTQLVVPSYVTPVAKAEVSKPTSVISPDGKMTLTMKEEKGKDSALFSFSIGKEIFSKSLSIGNMMSIPLNAFSPDDKYVFLKEDNSAQTSYIVLTTSGSLIKTDLQTTEVSALFTAKYPDYKVTDVTGWASNNLLVVNTDKVSGEVGPSFWFELPSQGFIQLSERFN